MSEIESTIKLPSPRFQLTLSDLFYFVAFAAVLAFSWGNHWSTPEKIGGALVAALIVGVCFVWLRWWVLGGVSVVLFVLLFGMGLPVGLMVLLMLIATRFWFWKWPQHSTTKIRLYMSMVCVAVGMLVWSTNKPARLKKLLAARMAYPVQDISGRLDYERSDASGEQQEEKELAAAVRKQLETVESGEHDGRREELEQIHDDQFEQFVRSLGFGVARMGGWGPYLIDTPPIPEIDFAGRVEEGVTDRDGGRGLDWDFHLRYQYDDDDKKSGPMTPERVHVEGSGDFLHPETFGYIESDRNVAGFLPHAFHFPLSEIEDSEASGWELKRLQLVSLLRFGEPRVYVLDHLPRMDHLTGDDVITRSLDSFEQGTIGELERNENVVFEETADSIRMVGALRAATTCLECHDVQRGDLLGAFTYEFGRRADSR